MKPSSGRMRKKKDAVQYIDLASMGGDVEHGAI
jgi:hypothetical protein